MANDLSGGQLTVFGVLAGMASLLFLMSALDPTNEQHKQRTPRTNP